MSESETTKHKLFVDISCSHLEQLIQKLYEVSLLFMFKILFIKAHEHTLYNGAEIHT